MTEPIFRRDGDAFLPTAHAVGPWDPSQLHGGAPGALIAHALDAPGFQVARITFDFLGPVTTDPLTIAVDTVKPGRRAQLAEAELSAGGRVVLRARALRLRREAVDLADAAQDAQPPPGLPADARPSPFPGAQQGTPGFHLTGMDIRFMAGSDYGRGPARAWFRMARPLVDDEPPSPLARVLAAADFGNGVSRIVDFDRFLFVNADLTVHVHREPAGEWVLLDARTRLEGETGAGLASSVLSDERGPLGLAAQSLFVAAR
ncbi:MAG: thioesterase family protein [Solirubrobacteraceae bacterium]